MKFLPERVPAWILLAIMPSIAAATDNLPSSALAVPYAALPGQVCGIEERNPASEEMNALGAVKSFGEKADTDISCTATVIGPRLLLTAGHCVHGYDPDSRYAVVCPGGIRREFDMERQAHVPDTFSLLTLDGDVGVIEVDRDLGIPPARIVDSREELSKLMASPERCAEFGFGTFYDGGEQAYFGLVHGTRLEGSGIYAVSKKDSDSYGDAVWKLVQEDKKALPRGMPNRQLVQAVAADLLPRAEGMMDRLPEDLDGARLLAHGQASPGDSGGPLLCRDDKERPVIIGVASSGVEKITDFFSSAWHYRDWIRKFMKNERSSPAARIETLRAQVSYRCQQAGACLGVLQKKDLQLASNTLRILRRIDSDAAAPALSDAPSGAPSDDEESIVKRLDNLQDELLSFIQGCFTQAGQEYN